MTRKRKRKRKPRLAKKHKKQLANAVMEMLVRRLVYVWAVAMEHFPMADLIDESGSACPEVAWPDLPHDVPYEATVPTDESVQRAAELLLRFGTDGLRDALATLVSVEAQRTQNPFGPDAVQALRSVDAIMLFRYLVRLSWPEAADSNVPDKLVYERYGKLRLFREAVAQGAREDFVAAIGGRAAPQPYRLFAPSLHLMASGRFFAELLRVDLADEVDATAFERMPVPGWSRARDYIQHLSRHPTGEYLVLASALWCARGYPSLGLPHKLAAALMFTRPLDADVPPPWDAFFLRIPDKLLTDPLLGPLESVLVVRHPRGWDLLEQWGTATRTLTGAELSPESIKREGPAATSGPMNERRRAARFRRHADLLCNLIAGVCYLAADPDALRQPSKRRRSSRRNRPAGSQPFKTAHYTIAKNVTIDLRSQVQPFLDGRKRVEGRRLKCQFVVRGHWRNQACGRGRKKRRMIWIQPFWKGPQEARILLRGHTLDAQSDAQEGHDATG